MINGFLTLQFLSIYEENRLVSMQKIVEKNRYMVRGMGGWLIIIATRNIKIWMWKQMPMIINKLSLHTTFVQASDSFDPENIYIYPIVWG